MVGRSQQHTRRGSSGRVDTSHLASPFGIRPQVAIGIVGPNDLVDRLVALAAQAGAAQWRLVTAPHRHERDTYVSLQGIQDRIDVALFAGQLQYELANAAGRIAVPATYIPLSGAELYAPLINAIMYGQCDPRRISVDSFARTDIEEIYADIEVPTKQLHSIAYTDPDSVKRFPEFHERLFRSGKTTAAFTSVWSVAERLRVAGIPTFRTMPTTSTLRLALDVAALLGVGGRLEESQITIAIVRLGQDGRARESTPTDYYEQELRLTLHRALLRVARSIGASVHPAEDAGYLVTMTFGALFKATDGFRHAPFIAEIEQDLSAPVEVGIGLGRTVRDAEIHATEAVTRARSAGHGRAVVIDAARKEVLLVGATAQGTTLVASDNSRGNEIARRLHGIVDDDDPIVDADQVARFLRLTPRSARRVLHDLVNEGVAWPISPAPSKGAGRPRQRYRLVLAGVPASSWPESSNVDSGSVDSDGA